ncbi:hypothetical protein [Salinimicrobium xinjiangense]|uniref:hypothetical protein n=1 Tax=Salinimicrobium xinjiangense TaxID=438596 RepID=UPI00041740DD|nr:hypothetical protein [Salinimicrobium xinjiangense]
MKKQKKFLIRSIFASSILFALTSCHHEGIFFRANKDSEPQLNSPDVQSAIEFDATGQPERISLIFSESTLADLPQNVHHLQIPVNDPSGKFPFNHLSLKWNPTKDDVEGIFTTPHFETGFHLISAEKRSSIKVADPLAELLPNRELLPQDFIPSKGSYSGTGKRWLNPTASELHEPNETYTLLVDSYAGEIISFVPSFTLKYLEEAENQIFTIPFPKGAQKEGAFYPTQYSLSFDAAEKKYIISLLEFQRS